MAPQTGPVASHHQNPSWPRDLGSGVAAFGGHGGSLIKPSERYLRDRRLWQERRRGLARANNGTHGEFAQGNEYVRDPLSRDAHSRVAIAMCVDSNVVTFYYYYYASASPPPGL